MISSNLFPNTTNWKLWLKMILWCSVMYFYRLLLASNNVSLLYKSVPTIAKVIWTHMIDFDFSAADRPSSIDGHQLKLNCLHNTIAMLVPTIPSTSFWRHTTLPTIWNFKNKTLIEPSSSNKQWRAKKFIPAYFQDSITPQLHLLIYYVIIRGFRCCLKCFFKYLWYVVGCGMHFVCILFSRLTSFFACVRKNCDSFFGMSVWKQLLYYSASEKYESKLFLSLLSTFGIY